MLCRRNILCLSRDLRQSNDAMERCEFVRVAVFTGLESAGGLAAVKRRL